jgi:excisionase family DNA binding protein
MSSNIRIVKVCRECGSEFIAQTTSTKYCSLKCARISYKKRKRAAAIGSSTGRPKAAWSKDDIPVDQKEILTVKDLAVLIGCSKRTAYRLIKEGKVPAINLATRMTRISKSSVFDLISSVERAQDPLPSEFDPEKYYTLAEVSTKYGLSDRAIYELIIRNSIPKHKIGWYVYVPKDLIDKTLDPKWE